MINIDQKIEDTLNSLSNLEQAEPKPFFYTRLKARMENELVVAQSNSFRLKPALLIPMVACTLLLTVMSVYTLTSHDSNAALLSGKDAFIQEYSLNDYGGINTF